MTFTSISGPHAGLAPVLDGAPLSDARMALILVHGRGGTADGMVPVARAARALDAALIAPRASGNSWYPNRFLAPQEENQPWLDSALSAVGSAVAMAAAAGIPAARTILVGFSQGACLSLEYVARAAAHGEAPVGGVVAMAGALVGDPTLPRVADPARASALTGTQVVLACGDADPHIPEDLVRRAAEYFAALGAQTELRIYPGVGHDIVGDQIAALRSLVDTVRAELPA
ncbi:MAG TPA: dienelactone hydrolase family protein [Gemmatimonas sp.]|uniref:alpha/beta hydrolase n=1 Tax=Gemmatimonas sp. TaxID=1962908 RepID=UPI002ED87A3B